MVWQAPSAVETTPGTTTVSGADPWHVGSLGQDLKQSQDKNSPGGKEAGKSCTRCRESKCSCGSTGVRAEVLPLAWCKMEAKAWQKKI